MSTSANVDNANVQKRNIEHETNSKKIRMDSTWIVENTSEHNFNVSAPKMSSFTKSQINAPSEYQGRGETVAQETSEELIIVKTICKEEEKILSSPVPSRRENQSSEFVVLSSTQLNSMEDNEYIVSNANISKTAESCIKETAPMAKKSSETLDPKSFEKKNNVEDVELVLVPTDEKVNKNDSTQNITNRYSDAGNKSHTTPAMINKINVQPNIQNKPVVVTKKFMQDVRQTTAKVSIGNTTISVPLLKPLNSKQLLNSGFTLDSQSKTHSIKYQQTVTQPKTQLNCVSKILNIKRNQKGGVNQPTIVSLSQLQIKPVSNAKILQAKVLGKKIPLQLQVSSSMPTQLTNPISSSSVTQISSKSKASIARNIITNIGPVNINNISTDNEKNSNEIDSPQYGSIECNTTHLSGENITKLTKNLVANSTVSFSTINQEKTKCVTTVKKFSSNDVSTPPSLTPLGGKYTTDQKNQPQTMGLSSGVNIVKQNAPQSLITTPALNTSICSTSLVSEFSSRTEMITSKQAIVRNKAHSKVNTITFPKNISLMLAKGTVPQQSKTVMGKKSEASIGLVSSKVDNKTNNTCISINKNIGDIQTIHVNEPVPPEHILLTASHSENSSEIQESNSIQNKTFKILNNQMSTLDQQTIKRLKLSNDDDDDNYIASTPTKIQINTKKQNLKISSKASTSENNTLECEFDNVDEVEKKHCSVEPEIKLSTMQEGDKLNINHNCNIITNSNNITTSVKSEETHNVLLKQIKKNCTTIPNANQTLIGTSTTNTPNTDNGGGLCSQVLQNRKVTNMRAPSLGLVSSLEAQLARPVIPPVSTGTNPIHRQNEKQEKVLIFVPTADNSNPIGKISHNQHISSTSESNGKECKLKSPTHLISKETSFVSNPSGIFSTKNDDLLDNGNTKNTSINSNNEHKDITKKDIYTSSINNQTEMSPESKVCRGNNKEDSSERVSENTSGTSKTSNNLFASQTTKTNSVGVDIFVKKEKTVQKKPLNEEDNLLITPNMVTAKINRNVIIEQNDPHSIKEDELKMKKDANVKQSNGDICVAGTIPSSSLESTSAETRNVAANIFGISLEKNYPVVKDIDLRKKRKREYQKQRRQMLNVNKEVSQTIVPVTGTGCASTPKRRPRKISKIEEDYDSFIDNLMVKVRQMAPLEVQEPLLNKSIAMSYEKQNVTRSISNKTVDSVWKNSLYLGEYGCLNHSLHSGIYDTKDGNFLNYTGQNISVIQNDFYDQEFIPVMYKNETDKLTKFISIIKERNMEVLNTVNNKCSENIDVSYTERNFQNMSYPGLILTNKSNSENLGRMSPIVQVVTPDSKKCIMSSQSLPIVTRQCLTNIKHERNNYDLLDSKFSNSNPCNSKDSTVVVSLHLLSSENVLSILRDLANILNISPLTNYKIYKKNSEEKSLLNVDKLGCPKWDKKYTYSNLQNIISGKRKICLTCGDMIHSVGIRIVDSNISKKKYLQLSQLGRYNPRNIMYFCNKNCYNLYRSNTDKSIDKERSKSICNKNIQRFEEKMLTPEPSKSNDIKKSCFKYFSMDNIKPMMSIKNNNDKDLMDMLLRLDITVTARNSMPKLKGKQNVKVEEDTRQCILCSLRGDGLSDGASRLLNFEVDKWVHLNCALWSNGVYETVSGGLMNLQTALHLGMNQSCSSCHTLGATIKCFKNRCGAIFHLPCAIKNQCVFYKNKTIQCAQHASRTDKENELSSLTVHRRVFVERDENCQVAAVMHHHTEQNNLLRVGSLTFLNIGQLLPHQLEAFHTANHIYPIGYKIIRLYWSMKRINKRCRYICSIAEVEGKPEFRIQIQEPFESEFELRDNTANAVWQRILDKISVLRKDNDMVRLFPKFVTGEDLFGLTEPTIVRIIESLPGIENLTDYRFKYGRNPLLELPLAVNPSGCARTEPKQRQLLSWRKPHTQRSATTFNQRATNTSTIAGEVACPYSKQFVHSKSSQYKKMKQEWRNNVYLARSKIQGLGLYAARDIEKHTMIIEYIGEVIRTEVSELREKQYESKNRGIYMFRLDEDRVVDATLSGGLARYINHSCNPNCVTETVEVDRELRIIIFAKRRINRSEELSYDYKFDIEDDAHKIPCMCGTPNCRKWMN